MREEDAERTQLEPVASRPHMPGYGLPVGGEGLRAWEWAERRLAASHNYWLATVRPDARPHLMIVWGLWLDRVFFFSTGRQSRKARNLALNASCVVATEAAESAVVVEGTASEVIDIALRKRLLALYQQKYKYDMSAMEADILSLKEPIYAIRPSTAFGLDEKGTLNTATRWSFR